MKLTFRQLINAKPSIEELLTAKPAPTVTIAYKLARNAREIDTALKDFAVARKRIIEQYVEADAIPKDRRSAYESELQELLNQEIDIELRVIGEDELARCEEVRPEFEISAGTLFNAGFMFGLDLQEGNHESTE